MRCPICSASKTRVRVTISSRSQVHRRRGCGECGCEWHTVETRRGKWSYTGRHLQSYGSDWPEIRAAIIEREAGLCKRCGAGGPLDVHHIVPLKHCHTLEQANASDNLVALCKSCHSKADQALVRETAQ